MKKSKLQKNNQTQPNFISDMWWIGDQLTHSWLKMSEDKMLNHLLANTRVDESQLKLLVNDYYTNESKRNDYLTNMKCVRDWILEYIR